jgi:hypothetical protein
MIKVFLLSAIIAVVGLQDATAAINTNTTMVPQQNSEDSIRIAELDQYWEVLSKAVKTGDFEGYGATYHQDAVIIFASGKKKTSLPIAKALEAWKQGFTSTKSGKTKDTAEFRFSQRIGDETTAHETGIFVFTSADSNGTVKAQYIIHFEMLLVKRNGTWLAIMEHQKSNATQEEWNALK